VLALGGADVNDAAAQRALRWERNRYIYSNSVIDPTNGWGNLAYSYYLFSSSKAYTLFGDDTPNPGNIGTGNLGDLPAAAPRQARRNPLTDPCARPAPHVCASAGPTPYATETPHWYYDYAYTIMSKQNASGAFNEGAPGAPCCPADGVSSQAYYVLVLERSLGGACVDTDQDGICDDDDNCSQNPNPGQENTYGDPGVGDACEAPGTVRLNAAAAPSSGKAGVTNIAVTGALWPAGAYTAADIKLYFAASCFGMTPVPAQGQALTLTTIAGATKRVTVKIPAGVSPGLKRVWLVGPGFSSSTCSQVNVVP
jgi:hypothetical protein